MNQENSSVPSWRLHNLVLIPLTIRHNLQFLDGDTRQRTVLFGKAVLLLASRVLRCVVSRSNLVLFPSSDVCAASIWFVIRLTNNRPPLLMSAASEWQSEPSEAPAGSTWYRFEVLPSSDVCLVGNWFVLRPSMNFGPPLLICASGWRIETTGRMFFWRISFSEIWRAGVSWYCTAVLPSSDFCAAGIRLTNDGPPSLMSAASGWRFKRSEAISCSRKVMVPKFSMAV
uniref:(northern house mosquito) hypothetical protein n=1 Tax=Culex pipiens TaxID=7175 RepID=A0A8D8NGL2_CULPI